MFSYPTEKLMRRSSGSRGQKWFNINRKKIRGNGKITRWAGWEVFGDVFSWFLEGSRGCVEGGIGELAQKFKGALKFTVLRLA